MKRLLCLMCLLALLTGCTGAAAAPTIPVGSSDTADEASQISSLPPETTASPETTAPEETTMPQETTTPVDPVRELLESMTLREKVGQLFFVAPESLTPRDAPVRGWSQSLEEALAEYPVGGIILFGDNITDPQQLKAFTQALRSAPGIPLFLGVDEEGGLVARLANKGSFDLPRYSSAGAVGASGNPEDALEMGTVIGAYLAEYGFTVDFAPVADVNTNPANPVIGTRAFSSDPELAARMAGAMAEGLRGQGIIPVFKHFPGHGDTAQDSHYGIAVSNKTPEQLRRCEWIPFRQAGPEDWVMVGHVAVPEITGTSVPATLCREVVTGILRDELGFEGLIITDSMSMGGITSGYTSAEAALMALEAGCDIILMPERLEEAFEGVLAAVESGGFSQERLDEIVLRILRVKMKQSANGG